MIQLLKKDFSNNNFKKINESNPFFKKKVITPNKKKHNHSNSIYNLSDLYFRESKIKIKNKTKYLFNDIIYHNYDESEKSILYRPIEKKAIRLIKKKKECINDITPLKKRQNIFYRKLKPTPFEKNLQKKKYLKKIILKKLSEIDNRKIENITNYPFSIPNINNKIQNVSFICKNNTKSKKIYLKKTQHFFNLSNIIHIENQIKIKKQIN